MKYPSFSILCAILVCGVFTVGEARSQDLIVPGSLPTVLAPIPDMEVTWSGSTIDLTNHFGLPGVTGPIYQVTTSLGTFNIVMLNSDAPLTVANFANYVIQRVWDNALVHRSLPGFIIQTGGYRATLQTPALANFGPIQNEPGVSNTRGTLSMAKQSGNPNSATNQWFVNLADNSGGNPKLDTQNGGFTVFAKVIGTGMDVADSIARIPTYDADPYPSPSTLFDNLPLRNLSADGIPRVENLIAIEKIRAATIFASGANTPSVITFSVVNPSPHRASISVDDSGNLLVSQVRSNSRFRVIATDTNGNSVSTLVLVKPPATGGEVASFSEFHLGTLGWEAPISQIFDVPPGVSFNAEEQTLSGIPRRSGEFRLRALLILPNGSRDWRTFALKVEPIADWISGNFDLLMERSSDVGSDLGGSMFLRATPNGLASGRLSLAGMNLPFRAQVEKVSGTEATLSVEIPARGRLTENLTVEVTLAPDGAATGRVVGTEGEAALAGWKRTWHPVTQPLEGERLGQINLLFDLASGSFAEGDPDIPQGTGWAMMRTARNGRANLTAKLADGSRATVATFLGTDGEFQLWRALYGNRGSVILQGTIDEFGAATGSGSWNRPPAPNPAARLYSAGFGNDLDGPIPLELAGGKWNRPGPGEIIFDLPFDSNAPEINAELNSENGGIESSVTALSPTNLIIDQFNRASVPAEDSNEGRIMVLINRNNGLVTVRALLQDDNPYRPGTILRRPVVQQLLLTPNLSGGRIGGGCFLLRQLPDPGAEPPTTNATSPILSGKVTLTALIGEMM